MEGLNWADGQRFDPGSGASAQRVRPSPRAGVANLWTTDRSQSRPVRNWATQEEVSLNVMGLNHPKTIPPPLQSVEKLSSTKLVPGAKKAGDR